MILFILFIITKNEDNNIDGNYNKYDDKIIMSEISNLKNIAFISSLMTMWIIFVKQFITIRLKVSVIKNWNISITVFPDNL